MATSNSNSKPTHPFLLATFITFFLFLLNKVNSSEDLSFTINKFKPNQMNLIYQGDASVSSSGELQVTKVANGKPMPGSVGRALYAAPVNIWDKSTGKVASFTTSFSFVVSAPDANKAADGFAFFLAPTDSQIPSNWQSRYLGLFNSQKYNSSNQIVAVEFDTFIHPEFDPKFRHIGVDVNEIKSIKTVKWDWRNGKVAHVIINYLAPIKTLTISLTYPSDETTNVLAANVDLRAILPEWVRVGFSAATGQQNMETHNVLSWSFTSTWEDNSYATKENDMLHTA